MGLLIDGHLLDWEETKKYLPHVRKHGILQFINLYNKFKNHQEKEHKWGDEVEYVIVKFLDEAKQARLSLSGLELLTRLRQETQKNPNDMKGAWTPEMCSFMIESSPVQPYGELLTDFNKVEQNLKDRRREAAKMAHPDEDIFTSSCYPRMGCKEFTYPPLTPTPDSGVTSSHFFPDDCLHPAATRFIGYSRNANKRRGEKVVGNLPLYKDKFTKIPIEDWYKKTDAALPDHIYMDALGLGGACCALQSTIQAYDLTQARFLYDQLAPLCPIMLAISAASPIIRGFLADVDCRLKLFSAVTDCRTAEEKGLKPLKESKFVITRTRCESIATYLSPEGSKFSDIPLEFHEEDYKQLVENGVDPLMARHIAYLFIKVPLAIYEEKINQNDEEEADHYESINTTIWSTLRIRYPIPASKMGWRVEFRPCEVQITDFESTALLCFVALISEVILSSKLNFLMPLTKVDENMDRAQTRDAVKHQKFWFRKDIIVTDTNQNITGDTKNALVELTVNEIINGKKDEFPGLISIIYNHLSGINIDKDRFAAIQKYLTFIEKRASGEILTGASWIRKFVTEHPEYRHDSVVTDKINYDLMKTIQEIQSGRRHCPLLLGANAS